MKSLKTQLCELSRGLQQYLKEEYSTGAWVPTSGDNLTFFRDLAKTRPVKAQKESPAAAPVRPVAPAPKPVVPRARIRPKPKPEAKKAAPKPSPAVPTPLFKKEEAEVLTESFSEVLRFMDPVKEQVRLVENPPSDEEGRRRSLQWKENKDAAAALFLSFEPVPRNRAFWQNVVRAVDKHLAPCTWIPLKEEAWDMDWKALFESHPRRLVMIQERQLQSIPALKEKYDAGKRTLWGIPLLIVPEAQTYFRDPAMKASLWQALCKMLQA